MDTYLDVDWQKCQRCGLCVEVCTYGILDGGRNHRPSANYDVLSCHHCDEPCKDVCGYGAIDWERW